MSRAILRALALIAFSVWLAAPASAENRVALVIGNDTYPNLPADRQLQKAVNDARAVGDALEKLGYTVIRGENLDRSGMVDRLFEFTKNIAPGDLAVVFYAGHGVSISGGNYLLPADIPMPKAGEELRVRNMAIGEADLVAEIEERKARVAVLIIDACRDNPFRQPGLLRSIGGSRGLARAQEAEGVFAIYSAGFGQSALDRLSNDDTSPNSVFTRVLAPALAQPGRHLGDLVIDVRQKVAHLAASIGHEQYPAYYDQTRGGRVYLAARTGAPETEGPANLSGGVTRVPSKQVPAKALTPATVPAPALIPPASTKTELIEADLNKVASLFTSLKIGQLAPHQITVPICEDCVPIVVRCQTKAMSTVKDLQGHKIALANSDSTAFEALRRHGATPLSVPTREWPADLRTGIIDCVAAGGTKLGSAAVSAPNPDTKRAPLVSPSTR